MRLLTSQKNELFDVIESQGLLPDLFEFKESISSLSLQDVATELKFKNSNYFFSFESFPVTGTFKHYAIYCPGEAVYEEKQMTSTWAIQIEYFKKWLLHLSREINSPNKWNRLAKEIREVTINFEYDEEKFSSQEYEDLKHKMLYLKNQIAMIQLPVNQLQIINQKLDHLTNVAKEMNKFDWQGLFIGTLISIIIQLGVTPENAKALWNVIRQIFNNYVLPQ